MRTRNARQWMWQAGTPESKRDPTGRAGPSVDPFFLLLRHCRTVNRTVMQMQCSAVLWQTTNCQAVFASHCRSNRIAFVLATKMAKLKLRIEYRRWLHQFQQQHHRRIGGTHWRIGQVLHQVGPGDQQSSWIPLLPLLFLHHHHHLSHPFLATYIDAIWFVLSFQIYKCVCACAHSLGIISRAH